MCFWRTFVLKSFFLPVGQKKKSEYDTWSASYAVIPKSFSHFLLPGSNQVGKSVPGCNYKLDIWCSPPLSVSQMTLCLLFFYQCSFFKFEENILWTISQRFLPFLKYNIRSTLNLILKAIRIFKKYLAALNVANCLDLKQSLKMLWQSENVPCF